MSGPPLGRPPARFGGGPETSGGGRSDLQPCGREVRPGQAAVWFGTGDVKLADTSTAQISLTFLVMNLERALQWSFFSFALLCHSWAALFIASRKPWRGRFSHQSSPA